MKINNPNDFHIKYNSINLSEGKNYVHRTLGKNGLNQIFTLSEAINFYDSITNKINCGYNLINLSRSYKMYGTLNGNTVVDIDKDNPVFDPPQTPSAFPWGAAAKIAAAIVAAGATVWDAIQPSHTEERKIEYHPNGAVKSIYTKITTDPTPINVEIDGTTYLLDHWGISNYVEIPVAKESYINLPVAIQFLGTNLGAITIEDVL